MSVETHKAVVPTWQAILNLVVLTAAFICNLLCLQDSVISTFCLISILCNVIAILSGAYYCFSGYRKNGQLFFKMFAYSYAASHLFFIMFLVELGLAPAMAGFNMISFGAICVLATGVDLGKKKSYLAAAIVLFSQLVGLILLLIYPEFNLMASALAPISKCLVAFLLCFIVYAKYRDKEHRQTK